MIRSEPTGELRVCVVLLAVLLAACRENGNSDKPTPTHEHTTPAPVASQVPEATANKVAPILNSGPAAPTSAAPPAPAPALAPSVTSEIPAVPTALSKPPTPEEWATGLEVNGTEASKRAQNCSMRLVREWVKLRCEGDIRSVEPDWNLWHDEKDKGRLWFESHSYPDYGELILRLQRGYNMGAVFHRKDKTNSARFFFDWDKKADRPKMLDLFRGKY